MDGEFLKLMSKEVYSILLQLRMVPRDGISIARERERGEEREYD